MGDLSGNAKRYILTIIPLIALAFINGVMQTANPTHPGALEDSQFIQN